MRAVSHLSGGKSGRYRGVTGYAVIDAKRHIVIEAPVDLATLARKLSALKPWEQAA
jgi:hypothetical protein